jgi:hypothetical protein
MAITEMAKKELIRNILRYIIRKRKILSKSTKISDDLKAGLNLGKEGCNNPITRKRLSL